MYYSWVGLAREVLKEEFGNEWLAYNRARWWPLTTLDLTESLVKRLAGANIELVVDLASKTDQELLHVEGIALDDLHQIKGSLSKIGLSLGMDRTLAVFALVDAQRGR